MPQRPARRHVLAQVRILAGLSQKELAKLLGCAGITVQKIEQGKLGLSEDLATKAQTELDISAAWLLANNPQIPAITPRRGTWSRDLYEFAQGGRFFALERVKGKKRFHVNTNIAPDEAADEFTAWRAAEYCAEIHAMLARAKKSPRQGILLHRLRRALDQLTEDFPPDQATLEAHAPRIARLHSAFRAKSKQIFEAEEERIWADATGEPLRPKP
jgi:transcriptional regulator with XRE-family HTH domain